MIARVNRRAATAAAAAHFVSLCACEGKIFLGRSADPDLDATTVAPQDATPAFPSDDAEDASTPDPTTFYGTWTGYVEAYQFPDGSDSVRVTIGPAPKGSPPSLALAARIVVGDAPVVPPPTNPDIGPFSTSDAAALADSLEGIPLTGVSVDYEDGGLAVGVTFEQYRAIFCSIQTRIYGQQPDGAGPPYGCLPPWPSTMNSVNGCTLTDPSTDASVPVDCYKRTSCTSGFCLCSAVACGLAPSLADATLTFFFVATPGHLDGTVVGGILDGHNVHLTKAGP
jgi:hypothetical protein